MSKHRSAPEERRSTRLLELDDIRWTAVQERDDSADGLFFYAVRSTGVFCRPSCPARRPLRANARFFPTPAAASDAGFRPCLRCRPDAASQDNPVTARVIEVCRALEVPDATTDLTTLARRVGWSPGHLQRVFSRTVGVSPRQYVDAVRLGRVKQSLRNGRGVTEAVFDAGYGSARAFYETGSLRLGMPPSTYGGGSGGVCVRWTIGDSGVGPLLVAATTRGLCATRFGPDRDALVGELAAEFPEAELDEQPAALAEVLEAVLALATGEAGDVVLPVDVRATAFQARVWEALRDIPRGTTRSYAEVAALIGAPTATRAVAGACAANPVAVVVPCHRVIRSDGGMGGYRWGLHVKAHLLAAEARPPSESGEVAGSRTAALGSHRPRRRPPLRP